MSARPTLEKLKFCLDKKKNCYSVKATSSEIKGKVVIPQKYNGLPITSICSFAFSWCAGITSIEIPNSITSIGDFAFSECNSLKSIFIPYGVLYVGRNSFHNCYSMKTIVLPNSLERIEDWAFSGCASLDSISIPDSVTFIGEGAFIHCSNIESFIIPKSTISIGEAAFSYCGSLKRIVVDESNPAYSSKDGILFNKDGSCLLCFPSSYEKEYVIPDDVASIGENAFSGCSTLTSIIIPENIVLIGKFAFSYCPKLESIKVLNSNIIIGDGAFNECSSLISVDLPNSVKSIGFSAFGGCSSLKTIILPFAGNPVFDDTFLRHVFGISKGYDPKENSWYIKGNVPQSLETIIIGSGYASIEKWTFSHCYSLKSIKIPASITSIDDIVFSGKISII